eukprot:363428-Chlamydomonas_euryale.AAC.8
MHHRALSASEERDSEKEQMRRVSAAGTGIQKQTSDSLPPCVTKGINSGICYMPLTRIYQRCLNNHCTHAHMSQSFRTRPATRNSA